MTSHTLVQRVTGLLNLAMLATFQPFLCART